MKQIIVLDTFKTAGSDTQINYAFWFSVPLASQVPKANATSQWRGASASDITALQSGAVIEEVGNFNLSAAGTTTQAKTFLQTKYSARLTELAQQPNPNKYYGVFYDDTTFWSA